MIQGKNTYVSPLNDIAYINPESIDKNYPYDEIEYIDISSVGSGTINGTTLYKLKDAPGRAKRIVRHKDTILSTVRPNRRSFLFIKNPTSNLIVSTGFAVLRPTEKVEPRFLFYSISDPKFTNYLSANVKGSAYPAVDKEILKKAIINVPSFSTQRKIAATLSAYDDLIENNLHRIKILEEMAQVLYREWFVHFRFPGYEKVRMVDSPLGKIPEGWEVKSVNETFEILGGGTPSKKIPEYWEKGTINWYTPSDLTSSGKMFLDESINKITDLGLKKSSARKFPEFSVMMTSRATIGVLAINTTEACTNQGFIICIPSNMFPLYTLYHWLNENVDTFIRLSSGATFNEISKKVFKNIELVVPQQDLVMKFEEIIKPIGSLILNLQRKNDNLRYTRDLLLPKLISGEIDLSDLDIDTGRLDE